MAAQPIPVVTDDPDPLETVDFDTDSFSVSDIVLTLGNEEEGEEETQG